MDSKRFFLVLIFLGFVLLPFALAEEIRVTEIVDNGLNFQRYEKVSFTAIFNETALAGADINLTVGLDTFFIETDAEGKFEFTFEEGGTYLIELFKEEEGIIYTGKRKINYLIDPGLYIIEEGAAYRICFVEPIGSVVLIEGESKKTKELDEENCADFSPQSEEFTVETLENEEFMAIEFPVKVTILEPEIEPEPTIEPTATPVQTPTPIIKQSEPDYTLPIAIGIVAIILVIAGLYLRKKRKWSF